MRRCLFEEICKQLCPQVFPIFYPARYFLLIIFHPFLAYISQEVVCEEYHNLSSAIYEFEGIAETDEFGNDDIAALDYDLHFKIHTKLSIPERP